MTDAPEKIWASVSGTGSEGRFGIWDLRAARADNPDWTSYTRTDLAEAAERAAYLRGLEDAGAVIRNACNCDLALDAIRALAKEDGE